MKEFLPNCLGFYVTIKTFAAEHLSPSICGRINGYTSPVFFYIQVNEGWSLIQCVNLGTTSPRMTHCHSLPYLTSQLRGIYVRPDSSKEGTCKRTYFTIKSINVPAKRPPFSTFIQSRIIISLSLLQKCFIWVSWMTSTLSTLYRHGDIENPPRTD